MSDMEVNIRLMLARTMDIRQHLRVLTVVVIVSNMAIFGTIAAGTAWMCWQAAQ